MSITMKETEQLEFLGDYGDGVLATIGGNGRPIPLPVWYVARDPDGAGLVEFYIRTPVTAKRLSHIDRDARVALLIHQGQEWRDLRGILLQCTAEVVEDEAVISAVTVLFERYFAGRDAKAVGPAARIQRHYSEMKVVKITPVGKNVTWDNRKIRLRSESAGTAVPSTTERAAEMSHET